MFVILQVSNCLSVSQSDEWKSEKIYNLAQTIIINNRVQLLCRIWKKTFPLHRIVATLRRASVIRQYPLQGY